jgi:3-hydroxyisobutyrate dehydrogenase-like beta-hydroxyacid dehydrogenase
MQPIETGRAGIFFENRKSVTHQPAADDGYKFSGSGQDRRLLHEVSQVRTDSMSTAPVPQSKYRLAYIGLGAMGAPMAATLLRAGHEVWVWNRTAVKGEPLRAVGARVLPSLAALRDAPIDWIFTNVSDATALTSVTDQLADILRPGLVVVDNSSVAPEAAQAVGALLGTKGIDFLDAPVTGGTVGAAEGKLTLMVGGKREVFERARALLSALGPNLHYLGSTGSGQACKLCNQVAAACAMLGLCEALALGGKAGLQPARVLDVIAAGTAGSAVMRTQGPKILAGDDTPGFRVDLMRKDLASAHELARSRGLTLSGSDIVARLLEALSRRGHGDLGWQAVGREFGVRCDLSTSTLAAASA